MSYLINYNHWRYAFEDFVYNFGGWGIFEQLLVCDDILMDPYLTIAYMAFLLCSKCKKIMFYCLNDYGYGVFTDS
jgi:hypothetical protein